MALFVGAAVWLLHASAPREGATADYPMVVIGPEGEIWNGTVHVERATAFTVLQAGSAQGGFALDVTTSPGVGSGCMGTYVRGIGDYHETTTGGWNYYVSAEGGEWKWVGESAACHGLHAGDAVMWKWVDGSD